MGRGCATGARSCAFALTALSLLATPLAHAARDSIPPECGSRSSFDAELRQRLGAEAPLETISVTIEPTATGFHLRVQIGNELRELNDESCTELFRAAIVVAIAVLMRERTPAAAEPAEPAAPPPRPAAPAPRPRFTLALGAGATAGILPPPVFSVELETKALWRHWGLGASLRYLAPGERRDAGGRGVRLRAVGAGLTGIFRPSRSWEARLGFAGQHLFGKGLSEAVPTFESQEGSVWAAGPTLGLAFIPFDQPPFWIGLGAEGQLNLLRGHFEILNYDGDIYDVPWLAGAAFVRWGLAF